MDDCNDKDVIDDDDEDNDVADGEDDDDLQKNPKQRSLH